MNCAKSIITLFLIFALVVFSCERPEKYGSIELFFTHTIDEQPIQWNLPIYTNTAGNKYEVREVKYFISRMSFVDAEGKSVAVKQDAGIHYVDCDPRYTNTLCWTIDEIPHGHYTAISFVFGLDAEDNISNRFVNPPENNFFWPEHLGGGYHYMQINGKFLNDKDTMQNMNIHTGIGQIRENDKVTFVQNYFTITLPVDFSVSTDKVLPVIKLNMEIQRWFDTPNVYNIEEFGTGIMQNQRAQELLRENGWNVFGIKQ